MGRGVQRKVNTERQGCGARRRRGGVQDWSGGTVPLQDTGCVGEGDGPNSLPLVFCARSECGPEERGRQVRIGTHWHRWWWDSRTPKNRPVMVKKSNCGSKKTGQQVGHSPGGVAL